MRFVALIAFALVFAGENAPAQETTNAPGSTAKNATPAITKEADEKAWSFSASVTTYIVPDFQEYVQPTFTADRGWLHLEARYNYENLETGSAWVGYNFGGGEKTRVGIHADVGWRGRQHDRHRARLQAFDYLLEVRAFQ